MEGAGRALRDGWGGGRKGRRIGGGGGGGVREGGMSGQGKKRRGMKGGEGGGLGEGQVGEEVIEIGQGRGRRGGELIIGYGFADADVNKFNKLAGFDYLNANENDCQ